MDTLPETEIEPVRHGGLPQAARPTLRLYVAGRAPNSALALSNLTAVCKAHSPALYEIEVVDVLDEPARAVADRVCMTPTLLHVMPDSVSRLVGSLRDRQQLLQFLGLNGRNQ